MLCVLYEIPGPTVGYGIVHTHIGIVRLVSESGWPSGR